MIKKSAEKAPQTSRITPRKLVAVGLVTAALASAGCETSEQTEQSKETKAKVSQVLKTAATKAARQALRIQKEHPDAVLYTDRQGDKQSIAIYINDKQKFPDVGEYRDELSLEVTMGIDSATNEPKPALVTDVTTDLRSVREDNNGQTFTDNRNTDLSSDGGLWHAMGGSTNEQNGETIDSLSTAFDTRYPVSDTSQSAVTEARISADSLATDIEVIRDHLKDLN